MESRLRAGLHGLRLIDDDGAAGHLAAVKRLHGVVQGFLGFKLHEAEAAGAAGHLICNDAGRFDGTGGGEVRGQFLIRGGVGKVADEHFEHAGHREHCADAK